MPLLKPGDTPKQDLLELQDMTPKKNQAGGSTPPPLGLSGVSSTSAAVSLADGVLLAQPRGRQQQRSTGEVVGPGRHRFPWMLLPVLRLPREGGDPVLQQSSWLQLGGSAGGRAGRAPGAGRAGLLQPWASEAALDCLLQGAKPCAEPGNGLRNQQGCCVLSASAPQASGSCSI